MKRFTYFFIFIFLLISPMRIFAKEEYFSGKVLSLISETKGNNKEGIDKILKFEVQILEGAEKGKHIEVEFPVYTEKQYNFTTKIGDKVVLYKSFDSEILEINEEKETYVERIDISDIDKRNILSILFIIFISATLIVARKKGTKSLIALLASLTFIIKIFIPAIAKGHSPILFAVFTCIFSTIVTTFFTTGFSKKALVAILGTTSGVAIAGLMSYSFGNIMRLTGYTDAEVLSYANLISNINLKELVSAGVIIGSLGAVMDVAVSISSSINELYENNPKIKGTVLFKSAMNIGNDIIGTMINTLILAYVGSSILTILLVYIQSAEYPLIRILNYEDIATEILRSVCGSIGILTAVPLTSYIGTKIYKSKKSTTF